MFSSLSIFFSKLPKPLLFLFIAACISCMSVIDFYLEPGISLLVFYLFPVFLATWYGGKTAGMTISLLCAAAWFFSDVLGNVTYTHPVIPFWNLTVTLGVFIIVSASLHLLKESLRRANELARTDPLTGAANRRAFFEIAGTELKRMNRYKRPFTIAYLDLDEFKHVNDHLGHEAGDMLLRCVASTIKNNIRSSDLLARIGGDEFVILLPETNEDQAQAVVQKIGVSLQTALRKENWAVSYGIGVVTYIRPPATVDDMLVKADHMLYAAKREGKNKVRFLVWKESAMVR